MGLSHKNVFALFIYLFRLILLWGNIFGKFSWKVNKIKIGKFLQHFFCVNISIFRKAFREKENIHNVFTKSDI